MRDLYYTPPRRGRIPETVAIGLFVLMLLSLAFLMLGWGYEMVWQILFLLTGAAIVFIMVRYLSTTYTYRVQYTEGVFLVEQRQGRRITVLCRLSLTALYDLRPYGAKDGEGEPDPTRYTYCNSVVPPASHLLFFDDGTHHVSIRVELSPEMLDALNHIVKDNQV